MAKITIRFNETDIAAIIKPILPYGATVIEINMSYGAVTVECDVPLSNEELKPQPPQEG